MTEHMATIKNHQEKPKPNQTQASLHSKADLSKHILLKLLEVYLKKIGNLVSHGSKIMLWFLICQHRCQDCNNCMKVQDLKCL